MTDDPPLVTDDPPRVTHDPTVALHRRVAERRRLVEVFGDVLPDSTRDDIDDVVPGRRTGAGSRDDELLRDVPPHHG